MRTVGEKAEGLEQLCGKCGGFKLQYSGLFGETAETCLQQVKGDANQRSEKNNM